MSRTKKFLGLVMALVMMLGCFTMAFAAGETASITVTSTATELEPGATANITVAATTNFTVGTLSVPVFYNKTLVDVSAIAAPATNIGDATIVTDANSAYADKVFANTGLDKATYGFILVTYIPEGAATLAANLSNAAVLTFTVTAKADVEGDAVITVPAGAQKTTSNMNGTLYMGASKDATLINSLTNVEGIALTAATANIEIGNAGPNTLVLKDEYADSGIIVDLEIASLIASEDWYSHLIDAEDASATGMIYGLDTVGYDDLFESESYTQLEDAFTTAYGDEYLEIITPEAAEGYETTGTIVNVLDKEGNVVETYYFIYFGDVNSDGYVDANDGSEVFKFDFTQDSITTVAATMAADYNGDSYMDANDGSDLFAVDFYQENYPVQADLAAAFYAAAYGL